jgi:hypothetical protein
MLGTMDADTSGTFWAVEAEKLIARLRNRPTS